MKPTRSRFNWRKLFAPAAVLAALGFVIAALGLAGQPTGAQAGPPAPAAGMTVFAETFEGAFPAGLWSVTNTTQPDGYTWGATTFTASQGARSAWVMGAPSTLYPPTATYTNAMSSWMIYGPLDLSGYANVQLAFDVWLDTAPGDYLLVGANVYTGTVALPGPGLSGTLLLPGTVFTGADRAWRSVNLDLPALGGQAQVWVGFGFISDDDNQVATGAFVDNIQLRAAGRHKLYLPIALKRWPPIPYAPLLEASEPDENGAFIVSWSYPYQTPLDGYTLQEAPNLGFSNVVTYEHPSGMASQAFSKDAGEFCYRIRAYNQYGAGAWSAARCVTVKPGAPVLNPINNPDGLPSYMIAWSAGRGAAAYVLQEAASAEFDAAQEVYSGDALSYTVSLKNPGVYYYRAKSIAGTLSSDWSNVVSTTVSVVTRFFDDFSNPASGWLVTHTMTYTVGYNPGGFYQIYIPLDYTGGGNAATWFAKPAMLAPVQPPAGSRYCVSADMWFASESNWLSNLGLIFGSNSNGTRLYTLQLSIPGAFNVVECNPYVFPYCDGMVWHWRPYEWVYDWEIPNLYIPEYGVNHMKVSVDGYYAEFYINGVRLGRRHLPDLAHLHWVGIIGGIHEATPNNSRFDNFMWSLDPDECPAGEIIPRP